MLTSERGCGPAVWSRGTLARHTLPRRPCGALLPEPSRRCRKSPGTSSWSRARPCRGPSIGRGVMLTAAELRTLLRHHAPPRRCTEDGLPQTCTELRHAEVPVRLPAHLGQQPFACSYLQVDHELLVPSNGRCPQLLRPQPARLQRLQHGRRLLRDVRHTLHASTVRLGHRARPRLTQRAYVATALAPPPRPEGCSWLGAVVVAPYSRPLPSELVGDTPRQIPASR